MVAHRTGGGHDGRVGNGRAVVAEHGTGQARGHADDEQTARRVEHIGDDRQQDAERAPARAGGEAQHTGDKEDDRRQKAEQRPGRRVHDGGDEVLAAEQAGHVLERGGEGQDHDGGDHVDEALRQAGHGILEGDETAAQEVDDREHERDQRAPGQGDKGVRVAERADEVVVVVTGSVPVTAGVDEAGKARHDQHGDGQDQVDDAAVLVAVDGIIVPVGAVAGGVEVVLEAGVHLVQAHRAVVELHEDERDDEHKREQRVEVIRNGAHEQVEAVVVLDDAGHGGGPGGDRRDHAHGCGRGVDEVGELGAGDLVPVGDGQHDRADGQAVEVVIDENEHAEQEGGEHGAGAGLDVGLGPAAEGGGAAGAVDERDHGAEDDEEEHDAGAVGDGGHHTVVDDGVKAGDRVKVGVKQRTEQDADEQRRVNFLRDECEDDGDDRRHECPERKRHAAGGCDLAGALAGTAFFTLRDAGTIARGAGDGLCRIVPVIGSERAHAQQRHGHDDEQQNSQDLASGIHLEIPPIKKCHEQSILFMTLETPGQ